MSFDNAIMKPTDKKLHYYRFILAKKKNAYLTSQLLVI